MYVCGYSKYMCMCTYTCDCVFVCVCVCMYTYLCECLHDEKIMLLFLQNNSHFLIISDNGIVLLPHVQYNMTFLSWQQFTQQDFEKNIHIR